MKVDTKLKVLISLGHCRTVKLDKVQKYSFCHHAKNEQAKNQWASGHKIYNSEGL